MDNEPVAKPLEPLAKHQKGWAKLMGQAICLDCKISIIAASLGILR
jgi:hypothetical protein